MAMSPDEQKRVRDSVAQLLKDEIHDQFSFLYAAAVSSIEMHPEQVNNELRNALTHLARSVAANTESDAKKELSKASSHIERAKRDVVKVAVIKLRDLIDIGCANINALTGTVSPAFILRRDEIRKTRKKLLNEEARGALVINDFVELYLETDKLNTDVYAELAKIGVVKTRWSLLIYKVRRYLLGALAGLLIGIFATLISGAIFPDNAALSNSVRHAIGLPPLTQPAPVASSPSKPATRDGPTPRP